MHVDIKRTLKSSLTSIVKQDAAVELDHMRLFSVYRMLKFGKSPLTPERVKAIERLDAALNDLSDARKLLGNAHFQIEELCKDIGVNF
jgi:hypothetical protein